MNYVGSVHDQLGSGTYYPLVLEQQFGGGGVGGGSSCGETVLFSRVASNSCAHVSMTGTVAVCGGHSSTRTTPTTTTKKKPKRKTEHFAHLFVSTPILFTSFPLTASVGVWPPCCS